MFQCPVLYGGISTRHRRDIRDMKPRRSTDNSKALFHAARRRPGTIFVSSGHLIFSTSSGGIVCVKPPTRAETAAMFRDDIIEFYGATEKSSNITAGGVFDQRAIWETADHFRREKHQIRNILREAGYGRGKVTARSSY